VAGEVMISHNIGTKWARKPVKTSLGAENSKESNQFEKSTFTFDIFEKKIYL